MGGSFDCWGEWYTQRGWPMFSCRWSERTIAARMRNGSGIERDEGSCGFAADAHFSTYSRSLSTRSAHLGFRLLAFDLTPARLLNFDRAQPSANRGHNDARLRCCYENSAVPTRPG